MFVCLPFGIVSGVGIDWIAFIGFFVTFWIFKPSKEAVAFSSCGREGDLASFCNGLNGIFRSFVVVIEGESNHFVVFDVDNEVTIYGVGIIGEVDV